MNIAKRFFLTAVLVAALILTPLLSDNLYAQQPVAALEWLTIDVWPDYDRPAVLVLLTGGLPEQTPLPARITFPLPEGATVNAVARISENNEMIDDVEYTVEDGSLSLLTPDLRFRVEYYQPYSTDGLRRQFSFEWRSEMSVQEMSVSVQQPLLASSMSTEPEAASVIEGRDGLQYHHLSPGAIAAGEQFAVDVAYTMTRAELTTSVPPEMGAAPGNGFIQSQLFNWLLVATALGGLLVLLVIGWHYYRRREARLEPRVAKAARYCHQCGHPAQEGDRFCRQCGTQLKGK